MKIKCLQCNTIADSKNCRYHQPTFCECQAVMIDDIGCDMYRVQAEPDLIESIEEEE